MSNDADDQLNYGILGEDADSDLDKLEKYTGVVGWDYLEKHYQTGALLYVDPSLDIATVGKAISDDDTASVTAWKQSGDLIQPSFPHALLWEESKEKFLSEISCVMTFENIVVFAESPETAVSQA